MYTVYLVSNQALKLTITLQESIMFDSVESLKKTQCSVKLYLYQQVYLCCYLEAEGYIVSYHLGLRLLIKQILFQVYLVIKRRGRFGREGDICLNTVRITASSYRLLPAVSLASICKKSYCIINIISYAHFRSGRMRKVKWPSHSLFYIVYPLITYSLTASLNTVGSVVS